MIPGGVAALNHRLQAGIPPGSFGWAFDGPVVLLVPVPVVSLRSTTGYRLASLRDAVCVWILPPVVSLRSTTGYRMRCLRHHGSRFDPSGIGRFDPSGIGQFDPSGAGRFDPSGIGQFDPSGIGACSRWLSAATPPDPKPPEFSTPAGVPANAHATGRFFEHHFAGVNKMVPAGYSERRPGINAEARELEAKIAENLVELLEA